MTRGKVQDVDEEANLSKGARRLVAWMEARDCRQADIAKAIGTIQQTISRYMRGKADPSIEHAFALQKECEIPASDWIRAKKAS